MLWRSGDQILVQRGDAFVVIDANGTVTETFERHSTSDEDDLWVTTYALADNCLVETTVIQRGFREDRVHEKRILLRDLGATDDARTRRIADAALAADDAAKTAREQARERDAAARLAAIPGSLDELGLGIDAERARRALCRRIELWDDERAAALLRTLVDLARARPSAAVVAAYARGCLLACFEDDVPALATAAPASANPALSLAIAALARELDTDADGQEAADAPPNAAALWRAAEALRAAAAMLG